MPGRIGMVLCAGDWCVVGRVAALRVRGTINHQLGDSVGAIEGDSISIEGPMSGGRG